MIAASDLRLENWVQTPRGKIIQIVSIQFDGINTDGGDIYPKHFLEDIEGIPLTPEILNKCSGNYGIFYFQPDYPHDTIRLCIDGLSIVIKGDKSEEAQKLTGGVTVRPGKWSKEVPWIQYLHQFQNLIFTLTGQELKCELWSGKYSSIVRRRNMFSMEQDLKGI